MIHKYKLLGKNIVLDIYSGAVHVVDDVLYDVLFILLSRLCRSRYVRSL